MQIVNKGKVLKLTSPICPSNNHYLDYRVIKKGKKNIVIAYKTKETKDYQRKFKPYVELQAKIQGWKLDATGTQHYYSDWTVYFPRVDMDASNYDKVLSDTITDANCVWKDDNIVLNRIKHIYYDSKNPRFEIEIKPVEYIGVFDSIEQYDIFEEHCKQCKRYKRNCSILNNAKKGKIQQEITKSYECMKYKKELKNG